METRSTQTTRVAESLHNVKTKVVEAQPAPSGDIALADLDPIGRGEYLIYGPPGGGKTVLAGTFPPPFRWIDADRGLKSLLWSTKAGKSSLPNTSAEHLRAYQPIEKLNGMYADDPEAFDRMCDKIAEWFRDPSWNTLVVDSVTELNEWVLNKGLSVNAGYPSSSKPLSTSHATNKKVHARILTGQQDYKTAMAFFEGWIQDVRIDCAKYNKNLVLLCHEYTETREDKDGVMQVVRHWPLLTGQLRTRIPKSFDDVWYLTMDNRGEPQLSMHGTARFIAKTRWGQIPGIDKEADYRKIIEKVKQFHS